LTPAQASVRKGRGAYQRGIFIMSSKHLGLAAAIFLLAVAAGSTGASARTSAKLELSSAALAHSHTQAPAGQWHRLNPDQRNPAPEHERLRCHQSDGAAWTCFYDKLPEPELNFSWNTTRGTFRGVDVTATWTCPAWVPTDVCANVTSVVEGVFAVEPSVGPPFSLHQDLVVTGAGPTEMLFVYSIDSGLACPWFRTFAQALDANPFPLPFNRVDWPAGDCAVAP
jgi:hypothetical protein